MVLEQETPFTPMKLEEERAKETSQVFTIRMNEQEYKQLQDDKTILQQPKDSTALKQLAAIGSIVIHSQPTGQIIDTLFINKKRNKRTGIVDYE